VQEILGLLIGCSSCDPIVTSVVRKLAVFTDRRYIEVEILGSESVTGIIVSPHTSNSAAAAAAAAAAFAIYLSCALY